MAFKTKDIDPNLAIKVGFGFAAYFVIIKPLLQWMGLKDDKEDTKADDSINKVLGWDPKYYRAVSQKGLKTTYLTTASAKGIAADIKKAWGTFNDNEEMLYAIFKKPKTWAQLSQIAEQYAALTGMDLAQTVRARTSDAEFNTIVNIVATYKKL